MNNKLSLQDLSYKMFYYRYKQYIIPLGTIFVCFFLLLYFIWPRVTEAFSIPKQIEAQREKNDQLRQNIQTLAAQQEGQLEQDFTLTAAALPGEKDFASILYAIASAANNANVTLADFDFLVGDLSTQSAALSSNNNPSLNLKLTVSGGVRGGERFIKSLYESLPMSEVTTVNSSTNTTSLEVLFYYKIFAPLSYKEGMRINGFTTAEQNALQIIQQWRTQVPVSFLPSTEATAASESVPIITTPTLSPTGLLSPVPVLEASASAAF